MKQNLKRDLNLPKWISIHQNGNVIAARACATLTQLAATSDGSSNLGSACATVSLLHPAQAFFAGWYGLHQDSCAREWISIIHHWVGVIYN